MIPSRARSLLLVLAMVLAACGSGGGVGDPGETLRAALASYEAPDAGTVRVTLDGDLARFAEGLGEEVPPDVAAALSGGALELAYDGERFALALELDGQRPVELRVLSPDELFVRVDAEGLAGLLEADGAAGLDAFLSEGGPFAPLLSGDWLRIAGFEELGEGLLPDGALDDLEAASAPDVDLTKLSEALEDVEVVDAGADGRCGGATRLDVTVDEDDVEAVVASLEEIPGAADLTGEVPEAVDLSAWVDGDALRCLGLDLGATAARSGDVDLSVDDARGEVYLLLSITEETPALTAPESFEELDLGALLGGFLGGMLGDMGDMGDMGDLGGGFGDGAQAYGDDPVLDALHDACEAGSDDACGELFLTSPLGSEYEAFGSTCGGRSADEACGFGQSGAFDDDVDQPQDYGDDPALDALWDACEGEDGAACDELWLTSPIDSRYEDFGGTCGDRGGSPGTCEAEYGAG